MPIYEYHCPHNHTIYQFYAKTLAQGQTTPPCPENPAHAMTKLVSSFAITRGGQAGEPKEAAGAAGDPAEDAKMEAAMNVMEQEFAHTDENDPRAMARMMRRMSELTGDKPDSEMEEVMRKLEEGADPESLEEQLGGGVDEEPGAMPGGEQGATKDAKERRHRWRALVQPPRRDPKLYDYP
ncbi:MAG: FmdB family transcriptional regulator [Opitutales bacterium]